MKQWLAQLSPRERRTVLGGAALLSVILVYFLAWQPFTHYLKQLRLTAQSQQEQLAWMRQAARDAEQLRAAVPASGRLPPGQSLLGVADQTAKSGNLGSAIKRIEPEGQNSARVWLEQAAFDDVIQWLQNLKRDYGIHAADIVIERREAAGRINARITLEGG
ncbi:MAG: type II secretion system protein M [Gammaproteobacteria bacterium]|nr:MAG: type II secretion system protein M [Gammaproteobacteria bacterium]